MKDSIKRYEKNPKATIIKLKEAGFKQEKDMNGESTATFLYTKRILEDIEVQVRIDIFSEFDDMENIQVYDTYYERVFSAFYNDETNNPFVTDLIKEYNNEMDKLVEEGILQEMKIKKTKNPQVLTMKKENNNQ